MEFLAKGKRGIVHRDVLNGEEVVVKEINPKTTAFGHLKQEFEILKELNNHSIGPKVISFVDGKLVMSFVSGELITSFLERESKENIVVVLRKVFDQLRVLDSLGINKDEMTNPYKHIIVMDNNPVLIDFERARKGEKPQNISQFSQFIMSTNISKVLVEKGFDINKEKIISAAKNYKDSYSDEDYKELLEVIGV